MALPPPALLLAQQERTEYVVFNDPSLAELPTFLSVLRAMGDSILKPSLAVERLLSGNMYYRLQPDGDGRRLGPVAFIMDVRSGAKGTAAVQRNRTFSGIPQFGDNGSYA
jgi:hypothetical protein